jgi:hypothetical protein
MTKITFILISCLGILSIAACKKDSNEPQPKEPFFSDNFDRVALGEHWYASQSLGDTAILENNELVLIHDVATSQFWPGVGMENIPYPLGDSYTMSFDFKRDYDSSGNYFVIQLISGNVSEALSIIGLSGKKYAFHIEEEKREGSNETHFNINIWYRLEFIVHEKTQRLRITEISTGKTMIDTRLKSQKTIGKMWAIYSKCSTLHPNETIQRLFIDNFRIY